MRIPQITGYRLEEVEVPAPKDEQQIINEVLGLTEPAPPPGPPRRVLRVVLEADEFPITEVPLAISIGDQRLTGLAISGGGTQATAFVESMPNEGDPIVFHLPAAEGGTLLAGHFDPSRLDTGIG